MPDLDSLFYLDNLSMVMGGLILFVVSSVALFSARYLEGDSGKGIFFKYLFLLAGSTILLVVTDHLPLFVLLWGTSNMLLAKLMVPKPQWAASRESGKLAVKNAALSVSALALAAGFLCLQMESTSIQEIIHHKNPSFWTTLSLFFLLISAMTQSALLPFHRWLMSSLNAPTPVSAVMHAGLVNGGGFLLARFSPLYSDNSVFLQGVFIAGLVTAIFGTAWKLMQSDVKSMLACSTVGQMGFMIMQCGLGLFPAAVAHLVFHGLFKAYLFLSSGSMAQESRLSLDYPPRVLVFSLALFCGLCGAFSFSFASQTDLMQGDTQLFLVGMSFIAGTQFAITTLAKDPLKRLPLTLVAVLLLGFLYGLSMQAFETFLLFSHAPQPLSMTSLVSFIILFVAWGAVLLLQHERENHSTPQWVQRLYVWLLNATQPHPKTMTSYRNHYRYM